jgi:hypothetical protein
MNPQEILVYTGLGKVVRCRFRLRAGGAGAGAGSGSGSGGGGGAGGGSDPASSKIGTSGNQMDPKVNTTKKPR